MSGPDILKTELEVFQTILPNLLKTNVGQFALIKDRQLAGTFTTFQEAYSAGLAKYGNVPFLIKQVLEAEPIQHAPALTYGLIRASV